MKPTQHDLQSEQGLLAAILIDDAIYKQIDVSIDDFYIETHRKIYQCICELKEEGIGIDYVSVQAKIKSNGWGDQISPVSLCTLAEEIPGEITRNWKSYVAIIKRKSAARKLNLLALDLSKISQNGLDNLPGKIDEAMRQLIEIKEKAENKRIGITEQVRDWVETSTGLIMTSEIHKELCLTSRDLKKQANEALRRLAEEGKVTPCGDKHGCYRKIEGVEEIDWLSADVENIYPIKWPFQLENLVTIFPGNIIVVAGEKNSGKSAFMYNLIKLNQHTHKINYFNSESGKEEMKLRLSKFEDVPLKGWRFKAYSRSSNFPEVIHPDRLNIIDYYEAGDKFYEIASEIRKIHDRLKKGICVIALQKAGNAEYGRGADFSREKSRMYITMGKGVLKIVDGKIWASEHNPNGQTINYKLVQGCRFIETGGSSYEI